MTYAEDRARRIEAGPQRNATIYNGPHSRQVRRARYRGEDSQDLSDRLKFKLMKLEPGQGLFMTRERLARSGMVIRLVIPAETIERRQPSADYSNRYKALF